MSNLSLARTAIENGQIYGLVLAGGRAERLGLITDPRFNQSACPKPTVQVATGAAIDYSIRTLEQLGIHNIFVLTTTQQATLIERQMYQPKNPNQKVKMWIEGRPVGTARAVDAFIKQVASKLASETQIENLTFIVMGSDNPNNVGSSDLEKHELAKMIESHLAAAAGTTVGITRIGMQSPEWEERSFATVVTEGLDYQAKAVSPSEYEDMLDRYYFEHVGKTKQITAFCEQSEQRERDERISNYLSTGFYAINGAFWMDSISPNLKHNFSDFGFHIFPAMADFSSGHRQQFDLPFVRIRKAMSCYRFNAYFLPEERDGNPIFWCDVGTPTFLLLANMRAVQGEFGILPRFNKKWTKAPWGLIGEDTIVDEQARLKVSKEDNLLPVGNIIGRNCRISRYVHIKNCVIGDNNIIDEKVRLENVVVLPGSSPQARNFISKIELRNGIITGGSIPGSRILRPVIVDGAIISRSPEGFLVVGKLKDK